MPLGAYDLLVIGGTSLACATLVAGVAMLWVRSRRGAALLPRFVAVALTSVAAIVLSTLAVAHQMYLSEHDLTVLVWVVATSAVLGTVAAVLTARAAAASIGRLGTDARRLGDGEVLAAARTAGLREVDRVSAELARSSQRLADARAEVERLDRARRQLVAWVSHDLRTPLAGIRAMAEALEDGAVEEPERYLRQLRTQVDAVNRMVDALFEVSTIHSGAMRLHKEVVALLDLVSDAATDVRPLAEARGMRVMSAGIDDLTVEVDPHQLTRVITNLLANSLRYAPEGSEVRVSAQRGPGNQVVLGVVDQGPGVPAADLERMFEVGWRADAARTGDGNGPGSSGAGLGLAIVRGIAEAHGGRVRAAHDAEGFRLEVVLPGASVP